MTKTLTWHGNDSGLSTTEVANVLSNIGSWFDPDAGQVVRSVRVDYKGMDDSGSAMLQVEVALRKSGVDSSNISAAMNSFATEINGFHSGFGTVSEIEDKMGMGNPW